MYASLYTDLLQALDDDPFPASSLTEFEQYTGLSSTDVGFAEARATLGAQTGPVHLRLLRRIPVDPFLKPPSRYFASWTRPDGDKRPAVLVALLVVAFSVLLFVPWFTDYFGLSDAAEPVFFTVVPALVVWFVALTGAYRFRLLDRVLGLKGLLDDGSHGR